MYGSSVGRPGASERLRAACIRSLAVSLSTSVVVVARCLLFVRRSSLSLLSSLALSICSLSLSTVKTNSCYCRRPFATVQLSVLTHAPRSVVSLLSGPLCAVSSTCSPRVRARCSLSAPPQRSRERERARKKKRQVNDPLSNSALEKGNVGSLSFVFKDTQRARVQSTDSHF